MAQDPWAQFRVSPAQSQPVPQETVVRQVRDPREEARKQAAENRAQVDQSLQIEAAQRAREDQVMQRQKFELDQQKYQADQQRQAKQDQTGTVEQGKAAGFLLRALKSNDTYEAQKIGPRSLVGQKMAENTPSLLNTLPAAIGNSPERQVADATQGDFIAATLRYESGAAIPPEEMEAQRRRYFPMPGDSQEVIDAKAELRRTAIQALKQSAGPLGEKTFQDYVGAQDGLTGVVTDDRQDPMALPASGAGNGNDPNDGGGGGFLSQLGQGAMQGLGDIAQGAGDILGIVGNPLNASINAVAGTNLSTDMGQSLRDALNLPDNPNQVASAINRGAVGGLGAAGLARGAAGLTGSAPVRNALLEFGATPIRDMVSGASAGGASQIAAQSGAGALGQVGAALAGGVGGYAGAGKVANRILGERTPNALMQAADDLGVTMLPADVGGVATRMATGGIGRTLGGIPLAEGAQKSIDSAAAARTRIAGNVGDVTDNVGAGQAVKRGFDKFTKSSKERGDQLYGAVSVAKDSAVQLNNTRTALAEVTQGLRSNPELSKLWAGHPRLKATLEALTPTDTSGAGQVQFRMASQKLTSAQDAYDQLRNQVVAPERLAQARKAIEDARAELDNAMIAANRPPEGGQLSWGDMNRFRSIVGEIIGQPGVKRDGSDIAALRKLYGALTSDMEATAAQASPRALQEFRRATQYWRGREARIDDVFSTLLGKDGSRSDEAVFKQINQWAQSSGGDFGRIARTIRSMPEDEANTVRATIVQRMGLAPARRQDVTQEVFSPAEFAAQWNGMSGRAKAVLFPNQQHRQDLDKLAMLMDGMKRADQYQNFSNTSLGVNVTTQGAIAYANLPMALTLALGQFGAGKLLASPKFARAIASTYKLPENVAARKLTENLKVVAAREPLIANDVRAVVDYVNKSLSQSPVRAAASEEEQNRGRIPPQQ